MATRLNYFAFYRELGFQIGASVSAGEFQRSAHPEKSSIVGYLSSGSPLVVVPGIADDPLDLAGGSVIAGGSVLTDGVWLWPQIAATLVDRHDIAVPIEFIDHMRNGAFEPRHVDADEARAIFAQTGEALSPSALAYEVTHSGNPRLHILEVRKRGTRSADCIARAELGPILEGIELWDSRHQDAGPMTAQAIYVRDERVASLAVGRTAKVTVTGDHVARITAGTVLESLTIQ